MAKLDKKFMKRVVDKKTNKSKEKKTFMLGTGASVDDMPVEKPVKAKGKKKKGC